MEKIERELTFRIDGCFITRLAREQFHYEGRMQYAKELLGSCMVNDTITDGERNAMILNILDGRAELHGVYPDDDFGFRYLDKPEEGWSIEKTFERMKREKENAQSELTELREKYFFIVEQMEDWERRKLQREFKEEYGKVLFDDIVQETTSTGSSLLDSYLKRMSQEIEDDYGWLEPNGTFHAVDWGEHQDWAQKYLEEKHPELTECDEVDMQIKCGVGLIGAGDWLVEHGWVLLHNPSQGIAFPTRNPVKRYTKAQKDFLYDYYMERDCEKEANAIMMAEDE